MNLLSRILSYITVILFSHFTVNAQLPLNWIVDEINPGEDISLYPDDMFFTEGSKSCYMLLHSGAVPYLISDYFYVDPGAEYNFSIDVFDNDTAGQVKVYADFYDAYGFNLYGKPPVFSKDSGQWQTISWQGIVPGQAVVGYILIKFYCQPDLYVFTQTAKAWVDNVQFREEGGNNMVSNGGFEQWQVGIDEAGGNEDRMTVYPNPASDLVNLVLSPEIQVIRLTDISGREVECLKTNGKEMVQLNVDYLREGVYILTAMSDRGPTKRTKILISR